MTTKRPQKPRDCPDCDETFSVIWERFRNKIFDKLNLFLSNFKTLKAYNRSSCWWASYWLPVFCDGKLLQSEAARETATGWEHWKHPPSCSASAKAQNRRKFQLWNRFGNVAPAPFYSAYRSYSQQKAFGRQNWASETAAKTKARNCWQNGRNRYFSLIS